MEALFTGEELTATECANFTLLSPSATQYHLKALQKWGIVELATRRDDARYRPWRATGRSLQVAAESPSSTVAESALLDVTLERDRAAVNRFLRHQDRESALWQAAMKLQVGSYWLTADEVAEVAATVDAALRPYRHRHRIADRPTGARSVRVSLLTVPLVDPRSDDYPVQPPVDRCV